MSIKAVMLDNNFKTTGEYVDIDTNKTFYGILLGFAEALDKGCDRTIRHPVVMKNDQYAILYSTEGELSDLYDLYMDKKIKPNTMIQFNKIPSNTEIN